MLDLFITVVVLVLSIPVFAYSAYTVVLLAGSLAYRPPRTVYLDRAELPSLTVLIACYNEEGVIGATLEAVGRLDYPPQKLQVLIADDSTDGTLRIVDEKTRPMAGRGVDVRVSRRPARTGFKAGALNGAVKDATGEFVLLLDADCRVSSESLAEGMATLNTGELSFVSFRVGHYNREENLVTRSFALFQDTIDCLQKMGSTRLSLPYSLQGGFVLVKAEALSEAGYWGEGTLAEDADLSCRLFAAGFKGAYLTGAQVLAEDPATLRVWKRQAARVAQGWAQCLRSNFGAILRSKHLGPLGKAGLLLTLLSPFAGLSWLVVTLVTAAAALGGFLSPQASIFSNPAYLVAVSVPAAVFYIAGVYALKIRKMLTPRNLALLPELSYAIPAMFTISAVSFVRGLAGRRGEFFRTPKTGGVPYLTEAQPNEGRGVRAAEALVSGASVLLSVPTLLGGQLVLGLSLLGLGLVTLKSMELSRIFSQRGVFPARRQPVAI